MKFAKISLTHLVRTQETDLKDASVRKANDETLSIVKNSRVNIDGLNR
jgi:hypothetical protein